MFGIGGSFVVDVVAVLERLGWTIHAYVPNEDGAPNPNGLGPVIGSEMLPNRLRSLPCVLGVGTPVARRTAHESALSHNFVQFPATVDPTAVVAHDAQINDGVLVNAGVVVASRAKLGEFAVINRSASIGHGTSVGEYSFVGPGATVCGNSFVASEAFLGAAAVVTPEASIGEGAYIGAGSVIAGTVLPGSRIVGKRQR